MLDPSAGEVVERRLVQETGEARGFCASLCEPAPVGIEPPWMFLFEKASPGSWTRGDGRAADGGAPGVGVDSPQVGATAATFPSGHATLLLGWRRCTTSVRTELARVSATRNGVPWSATGRGGHGLRE